MGQSDNTTKTIRARFFQSDTGREPVREWLTGLDRSARTVVGRDIMACEFQWPVGPPVCRPFGQGLYEVRSILPGNIQARVFFTIHADVMVLLHGFVKKSQRTPKKDIETALARKKGLQ